MRVVPFIVLQNAAVLCEGLSRIGYTPPAAIAEVTDNSVDASRPTMDEAMRAAKQIAETYRRLSAML